MKWLYVFLAVVLAAIAVLGYFTLRQTADEGPGPGSDRETLSTPRGAAPAQGATPATSSPAKAAIVLRALSPHPETIQNEFERAFSKWHEEKYGQPVQIVWGDVGAGTSGIVRYISTNFKNSPQGIGLDILWGGGSVPFQELAAEGLLEPVTVSDGVLNEMIPHVTGVRTRDAQFRWYGTALSGFGIVFNKQRLARKNIPEPKTWEDLASGRMFDEVGAADPRKSGSAYAAYEIILQALGWEKGWGVLVRMAANSRRFYLGASDVPKDVSLGEISAGPAIDFYAWTQVREDGAEKIGYVSPATETVMTPDSIAVLKGAPNREVAVRFVEFVLSEEGQRLWVLKPGAPGGPVKAALGRVPVRKGVYEKYKDMSVFQFDAGQLESPLRFSDEVSGARHKALKDLYGAALIDVHPELVAAWGAILKRGAKAPEVAALCRPLLTSAELSAMSSSQWDDSAFRNRKIAEWSSEARRRYEALARGETP